MAGSIERCSSCKVQLLVPPEAKTIRCGVCQSITRIHSHNHFVQSHESISQATGRLKSFLHTVSSNLNSLVASVNNHPTLVTNGFGPFPQPVRPPALMVPASAHGKKRAVLCGVSYYGQRHRLNGTINDVMCMKYFLVEKMGFPNDSILVLTEEANDPFRIPTKQNIRIALQWLVHGCQSGDSLVFHYSGHGSQQRDLNGDEVDGYDEKLWPVDHATQGAILDDEINTTIVRPLPRGTKLHAVIDACHSGTVLDLPFVCRMDRNGYYFWEDHGQLTSIYKGTNGGIALSISACEDHKITVDTTALSGNTATGAMTYSFIQAAQNAPGLTYGHLLNAMRNVIREVKIGLHLNGPIASFVRKMLNTDISQEPQLSSSKKFDIYKEQFML